MLFYIAFGVIISGIIVFEQNQVQNPDDADLVRCLTSSLRTMLNFMLVVAIHKLF